MFPTDPGNLAPAPVGGRAAEAGEHAGGGLAGRGRTGKHGYDKTQRPSFWAESNVGEAREALRPGPADCSHGDTLDDIPGNAFLSSIVELGGLGVGVAGQVLDVLEGHVLGKQVGHDEDAEAVGAKDIGQAGIFEPSFEHTAHGVG